MAKERKSGKISIIHMTDLVKRAGDALVTLEAATQQLATVPFGLYAKVANAQHLFERRCKLVAEYAERIKARKDKLSLAAQEREAANWEKRREAERAKEEKQARKRQVLEEQTKRAEERLAKLRDKRQKAGMDQPSLPNLGPEPQE